jgi:glyoxylase I family protein
MALQTFSHVGVCVSDLDRSTAFYTRVLGFRELFTVELGPEVAPTMEIEGRFTSRMLTRDDVRVELLHWIEPGWQGDRARRPMNQLGMTHLCFRVEDIEDLFVSAERFGGCAHRDTLSVMEGAGPNRGPVTTVYLSDPDGVRIECISGTPDLAAGLKLLRLRSVAAFRRRTGAAGTTRVANGSGVCPRKMSA